VSYDHQAIPDSTPLGLEDFETVRAVTSPDTAHAIDTARRRMTTGEFDEAMILLASKLALMDLRYQDAEAVISVLLTHAVTYAEAIGAGGVAVTDEEVRALRRAVEFVAEKRPTSTLADLVYRVKRLAMADAAALFSVDN